MTIRRIALTLAALFSPLLIQTAARAQGTQATCTSATIPVCQVPNGSGTVTTKPVAIPTSTATVATSDVKISQIVITSSTAITVTVADRQASPVAVLNAVSIAAGQTYVISFSQPYWAPSGLTVVASGSGATVQFTFAQ